jgi:hypothetical protein
MKTYLTIILLLPFFAFTQSILTIVDSLNRSPLEHVAIYNSNQELIGLSNEQGTFSFNEKSFPMIFTCYRYHPKIINKITDTVYMAPQGKMAKEVVVGQFDLASYYQKLVSISSVSAASNQTNKIYGTYLESILIIDIKNKDSIYLGKVANLTLVKNKDKKDSYQFFPNGGKKTFWSTGKHPQKDSSKYEKWADIIPQFNSLLDMDLSNPKAYQLNFKKYPLMERTESSLLCGNNTGDVSQTYRITFNDKCIETWENETHTSCDTTKTVDFCFAKTKKAVQFNHDEINYYLSNGLLEGEIIFKMNGEGYLIKLVKGFVEQDGITHKVNASGVSIESYFKDIPYTFTPAFKTIFTFHP